MNHSLLPVFTSPKTLIHTLLLQLLNACLFVVAETDRLGKRSQVCLAKVGPSLTSAYNTMQWH